MNNNECTECKMEIIYKGKGRPRTTCSAKCKQKKSYKNNKLSIIERSKNRYVLNKQEIRKYQNDIRKKNKERIVSMFGSSCSVCKQSFPNCVYDLHHRTGKDYSISSLIGRLWNSTLEEELEKCILVCSNCHRMIHHNV